MKTIHKYRLAISTETQEVELPERAEIRSLDYMLQDRAILMWVEVDADTLISSPKTRRRFRLFKVGDGIPDNASYVASTVDQLRPESYHVYELTD